MAKEWTGQWLAINIHFSHFMSAWLAAGLLPGFTCFMWRSQTAGPAGSATECSGKQKTVQQTQLWRFIWMKIKISQSTFSKLPADLFTELKNQLISAFFSSLGSLRIQDVLLLTQWVSFFNNFCWGTFLTLFLEIEINKELLTIHSLHCLHAEEFE